MKTPSCCYENNKKNFIQVKFYWRHRIHEVALWQTHSSIWFHFFSSKCCLVFPQKTIKIFEMYICVCWNRKCLHLWANRASNAHQTVFFLIFLCSVLLNVSYILSTYISDKKLSSSQWKMYKTIQTTSKLTKILYVKFYSIFPLHGRCADNIENHSAQD